MGYFLSFCGGVRMPVSAKEYCQLENFDASCPEGSVVLMRHAEYGRMNLTTHRGQQRAAGLSTAA